MIQSAKFVWTSIFIKISMCKLTLMASAVLLYSLFSRCGTSCFIWYILYISENLVWLTMCNYLSCCFISLILLLNTRFTIKSSKQFFLLTSSVELSCMCSRYICFYVYLVINVPLLLLLLCFIYFYTCTNSRKQWCFYQLWPGEIKVPTVC